MKQDPGLTSFQRSNTQEIEVKPKLGLSVENDSDSFINQIEDDLKHLGFASRTSKNAY
jgi:hypothetical protein